MSSKAKANHGRLVVSGVFWNGLQLIINQGFAFVIRLILAKILFPSEFGIVGMAAVFTGFIQVLNDLGIGAALVQKKDEELADVHYFSAFWIGLAWSILLYLAILFWLAPFAADFYNEGSLGKIIPFMSLGLLISPFTIVQNAVLTKRMDFRKLAIINNISSVSSGIVSLIIALCGGGIWALVSNAVAPIIFSAPLFYYFARWTPKFKINKSALSDVFAFGIFTTGTNILNYFINNIDYLLIGKMLNASMLGAYTFAFILTDTFRSRLMAVMNNVMYPMYGKNQDDLEKLKRYYLKVVAYNSVIVFPVMIFFIVYGKGFVSFFFGEKWDSAILPLQILSLSVMFHMLVNSNTALIRGLGKPGLEMKLQILKAIIFIPMLYYGISYHGVVGAAVVICINKVIAVVIAQFTFRYLIKVKITTLELFDALKKPIFVSCLTYGVSFVINSMHCNFILGGIILFSIYGSLIWITMKADIYQIVSLVKKKK